MILVTTFAVFSVCVYVYYKTLLFDKQQADNLYIPFTVVDIPGKGKGAIATRDIQVCVLASQCLLRLKAALTSSKGSWYFEKSHFS